MSIKLKVEGNSIHYNEHYLLNGLDRPNQHPISAIIGLLDELNNKYVLPVDGIPDEDLKERYLKKIDFEKENTNLIQMYTSIEKDINILNTNYNTLESNVSNNTDNITELLNKYEILQNQIDNIDLSNIDGLTCIKQEEFKATDDNKEIIINISDTDLKVIEPTIIKSDNTLAHKDTDYSISYPSDTELKIVFINNDNYKINYISGNLSESEYNYLLNKIKELEKIIDGYGVFANPSKKITIEYNDKGYISKEIYTGDINKTITYSYDDNNNIIKKTVSDGNVTKIATYTYNSDNKLISVNDNGTNILIDGTNAQRYSLSIEYNSNNLVAKEIYTGDINKTIEYTYNALNDIKKKIVTENGITKECIYYYDISGKLIEVQDEGTDRIGVAFKNLSVSVDSSGSGTGGQCSCCIDEITEDKLDAMFNTIFKE